MCNSSEFFVVLFSKMPVLPTVRAHVTVTGAFSSNLLGEEPQFQLYVALLREDPETICGHISNPELLCFQKKKRHVVFKPCFKDRSCLAAWISSNMLGKVCRKYAFICFSTTVTAQPVSAELLHRVCLFGGRVSLYSPGWPGTHRDVSVLLCESWH